MNETSLTEVNNCMAWEVVGRNTEFPWLFECGKRHYHRPYPGMLVTSYYGQERVAKEGLMGLGVVVSVVPHPKVHGDVKWLCLTLWNFNVA